MYSSDKSGLSFGNHQAATLPSFAEDGQVDPNTPTTLLPDFEEGPALDGSANEGGPVLPDLDASTAVPLPEFSTERPIPGRPGIMIPVRPQPNPPCFSCNSGNSGNLGRNARIRFLNAAAGYRPFRVYINGRFIANGLGYASLTPYGRVAGGFQTVTVTGVNGYIYLQKSMPIRSNDIATLAIINTPNGIDLMQISDASCARPANMSCLRACNLAANTNPLDMILYDGRVVFSDIRFKEVTAYRRVRPGEYEFYLAETNLRPMPRFMDIETVNNEESTFQLPTALVSFFVEVGRNASYTVYILTGANNEPESVQVLVIEDR